MKKNQNFFFISNATSAIRPVFNDELHRGPRPLENFYFDPDEGKVFFKPSKNSSHKQSKLPQTTYLALSSPIGSQKAIAATSYSKSEKKSELLAFS